MKHFTSIECKVIGRNENKLVDLLATLATKSVLKKERWHFGWKNNPFWSKMSYVSLKIRQWLKESRFGQNYCKVEFNQPSCWLYSVPNLLVFQHLVTLYLGGIVVKVVSEIECWNAQECARKQRLTTGSHGWLATASRQKMHTCQACQKLKRHAN